jgi:hypothetical protein
MSRPLSSREKTLAALVGTVAFLFANFLLIDWGWKTITRTRADLDLRRKQLRHMESLSADLRFWEQRDAWLQARQPRLASADAAGVQLLDQIKELAKKHGVLLENPAIRVPERQPEFVSISVEIETKSPWPPLVALLHELQSPEHFNAVESANLKIDAADPTQMRGRFRIARWYAP